MKRWLAVAVVLIMAGTLFPGMFVDQDTEGVQETSVVQASKENSLLAGASPVAEVHEFEVLTEDGFTLRGHVHLPEGPPPYATILEYSPYWNSIGAASDAPPSQYLARFLDEGFALAFVNARGTGLSQGCKAWLDASIDGPDINTVIEGIVSEPWSNGNVGMVGHSWPGYTQYASLYDPHPSLKALVPTSAVIDAWSLFTRQGAFVTSQFGPSLTTYAAFTGATVFGPNGNLDITNLQCPQYLDIAMEWNDLTVTGDKNEFWQGLDNRDIIAAADVPMWVSNGLKVFGEAHISQVEGLWELMGENGRLIIGQWSHEMPTGERGEKWRDEVVAWFDHYLRDGPLLVETGVVEYQDSATLEWLETDMWPPASSFSRIHLSDGVLTDDPTQVQESTQLFQGLNINGLPQDCPGVQAMYVSAPLAEDVHLAGNLLINLTLTSSLPQGLFGAYVYGVEEIALCGEAMIVTDAFDAIQPLNWVSQAVTPLSHRGYLDQGEPFPMFESDEMLMTSHPFARTVKAGERIVLVVTGGSLEVSPRAENPLLGVHTGPGLVGELLLPVVEGELRFEGVDGGHLPVGPENLIR